MFFLGDTFNSFDDVINLKDEFSETMRGLDIPIYLLKGNHESLNNKGSKFSDISFSKNIFVLDKEPLGIIRLGDGLEILAVPYQNTFSSTINIPPRGENVLRILIAHGIVEGTMWQLEEDETLSSVPIDILKKSNADLSLIGHIHKHMEHNIDGLKIVYLGSSRVCRKSKSERGSRVCLSLKIEDGNIVKNYIKLKSTGEYKVYNLIFDDNMHNKIKDLAVNWSKNDIIEINIKGIAQNENSLNKELEDIANRYGKYVREINVKSKDIIILSSEKHENIINEFLVLSDEYMKNAQSDSEKEIIEMARFIGLEKISLALKSKK